MDHNGTHSDRLGLNGATKRPPALAEIMRRLADVAEALGSSGSIDPLSLTLYHAGVRLSVRAWRGGRPPGEPQETDATPEDGTSSADEQLYFLRKTYLGENERALVKALHRDPAKGTVVARRIGVGLSRTKVMLSLLVDRGIVRPGPGGYELTSPIVLQTLRDLQAEEKGA